MRKSCRSWSSISTASRAQGRSGAWVTTCPSTCRPTPPWPVSATTWTTYSSCRKVDFQKHNLDDLSDDFFTKFYRAEEINISGNNLTKIPSGFADTKYLTYLNLSKNRLTSLPADIHELADTMEILDISDNPFQDMPNCVFQLTGLTKLYANKHRQGQQSEGHL